MFSLTFLGHQSWLVSTRETSVLVDPLLCSGFGHGGHLGQVYPPRLFDFDAFPPIDAVLLTHEHDDHFDLPSLARIDRRVPVYLASRSSAAARELLVTMGFDTRALEPEARLQLGELVVHSLSTDHRDGSQADEWDTTPLFIHEREGHGSWLSSVDVHLGERELSRLAHALALGTGRELGPGLWSAANNCSHAGFQTLHTSPPIGPSAALGDDSVPVARRILARHDCLARAWRAPALTLVSGAGWTLPAERSHLNHHLFPADHPAVLAALASLRPELPVDAPRPGQSWTMLRGQISARSPAQPFLSTPSAEQWPGRDYRGPGQTLRDYGPACGLSELGAAARDELLAELVDFARFLYGGPVFAAIHSLPLRLPSAHLSSFCLVLRDAVVPQVLAYDPSRCAFVPAATDEPASTFASGLECWASDLHALVTGALAPSALCYAGRMRVWNHAPRSLWVSPALLWHYASPLRRPERAARLYRKLLAELADAPILVSPRLD